MDRVNTDMAAIVMTAVGYRLHETSSRISN